MGAIIMGETAVATRMQWQDALARSHEKRRFQRVRVSLIGRYMLQERSEFPCQTIDMSPGGVALLGPVPGEIGTRVIAYLDQIGRVEGTVVRHFQNGFALALNTPQLKREKTADKLTWLANRHALGMPEDRRHERIVPRNQRTTLKLSNGHEHLVKLIDVSISGAAMNTDVEVPMGTLVTVGQTLGQVVRVFQGGIAVEFRRLLPVETFDENVRL